MCNPRHDYTNYSIGGNFLIVLRNGKGGFIRGDPDILKNNEMAHELVKEFSGSLECLAAM
jgi:hypothetical protein